MKDTTKGILAVSVGSIALGSIGIFVRFADQSIAPMTQTFGRIFVAFLCITIFNLVTNRLGSVKIKRKDLKLFVLNGLIGFGVMASSFTLSILHTSITNTYFLLYTAPVWVVILSYLFLKEKTSRNTLVSIAIGMLGIIFLFNPSDLSKGLLGNIFGLATGIALGSYFIITGYLGKKYSTTTITFWTNLFGAISLFPLIFIFDKKVNLLHSLSVWFPVIAAGIMVFIGYILLNYGLRKVKASVGSVLSLFEPLSSVAYGFIFFTEIPVAPTLFGAALILSSIGYLAKMQEK